MATIDELARKSAITQIPAGKAQVNPVPSAVDQIPTGGLTAPAYDGSGSTELGRNVSNTINALAGVAPAITGANVLLNASRLGSLAQAAPDAINVLTPSAAAPIVTPGVSPTGGISKLVATPPPVPPVGAIQAQAQQTAAAPIVAPTAKAPSAIQQLGNRRQPLNVPLQQNAGTAQNAVAPAGIPAAVAQPDLPENPIAYVGYGGNNSTQVAYKDGRTMEIAQGQAMPEDVKAFNLISQQAGQQGGNVNVMRGMPETYNKDGSLRSAGGVQQTLALPAKPGEAFMREVPVELGGNIAAIGKYQAAQSQGAINAADPVEAATQQELAKVSLQNDGRIADAKIQAGATTGSAAIRAAADRYGTDVGAKTNIAVEASRAETLKKNLVMNPEQVGVNAMGEPIIKDVPYIRNQDGTMRKAIQEPAATNKINTDKDAIAIRDNKSMTTAQKQEALKKLGY